MINIDLSEILNENLSRYALVIGVAKRAVEIIDDILILHKKEIVSIPVKDIQRIDVHNADGSFDILVKTATQKYSMHCFVKEQRQKKVLFIDYLKNKNIKLKTYDSL